MLNLLTKFRNLSLNCNTSGYILTGIFCHFGKCSSISLPRLGWYSSRSLVQICALSVAVQDCSFRSLWIAKKLNYHWFPLKFKIEKSSDPIGKNLRVSKVVRIQGFMTVFYVEKFSFCKRFYTCLNNFLVISFSPFTVRSSRICCMFSAIVYKWIENFLI